MSLINCPECKKEISDKSKSCIHCGLPLYESTVCEIDLQSLEEKIKLQIQTGDFEGAKKNLDVIEQQGKMSKGLFLAVLICKVEDIKQRILNGGCDDMFEELHAFREMKVFSEIKACFKMGQKEKFIDSSNTDKVIDIIKDFLIQSKSIFVLSLQNKKDKATFFL